MTAKYSGSSNDPAVFDFIVEIHDPCMITQVETSVLDDVTYYYGDGPIEQEYSDFISIEGDECNYFWTYSLDIERSINLDDAIVIDPDTKVITIEAAAGEDSVTTVVLNGQMSNGKTTDSISFVVRFKNQADTVSDTVNSQFAGSGQEYAYVGEHWEYDVT